MAQKKKAAGRGKVKKAKTASRTKAARPAKKTAAARKKTRKVPETLRLRSLMGGMTVNDLSKSLAFYVDGLGFVKSEDFKGPDGTIRGAMLKAGKCELGLGQDDWAKGRGRTKGVGCRIYAETVQDIDALAARVRKAGGTITAEPQDQSWGARSFDFDDPDGFHLTFFKNLKKAR